MEEKAIEFSVTFDPQEIQTITRRLKQLGDTDRPLARKIWRNGLSAGGGVIKRAAQAKAPTRKRSKKGKRGKTLKASIKVKAFPSLRKVKIYASKPTGHLLELGHKSRLGRRTLKSSLKGQRAYKARGHIAKVAPRPFLKPAIETSGLEALTAIELQFKKEFDKLVLD